MKHISHLGIFALVMILACNKPSSIGAGFLEEDVISLGFIDTLDISVKTIPSDTIAVYSPGLNIIRSYPCGRMDDPVFGKTVAEVYSQMSIGAIEPFLDSASLDSIILTVALDSSSFYAFDFDKTYSFEVHRVLEEMDLSTESYSNKSYEVGDLLGGLYNFKLDSFGSVQAIEPLVGTLMDTVNYVTHLRIPLSEAFGQELIDLDTTENTSAINFREYFEGIRISMSDDSDGMFSFSMDNDITRVRLYYTRAEDTRFYDFDLTNLNKRTVFLEHDYAGSPVEEIIDNAMVGDTAIYLQGLAGLDAQFEFLNIDALPENIIVNKAELVLTAKDVSDLYTPSNQLVTFTRNSDGNLNLIQDVIFSDFIDPRIVSSISGGSQIIEDNMVSYRLNLTSHFQGIVEGTEDNILIVSVHPNVESGSRTILYGPNSPEFPARLEIVYTLKP